MKVVHICTSLSGGAGLCTKRIITATRAFRVDARAVVAGGEHSEEWISLYEEPYPWSKCWLIQKLQVLLNICGLWPRFEVYSRMVSEMLKKGNLKDVCVTSPISRYSKLHEHPWVKEADIVHLHWVGGFLNYETFFKNLHKPIVWTIHDENPGLGGFHYTSWRDASTDSFMKLERKLVSIKQKAYAHVDNMTLVAISVVMKQFFQSNELLSQFPIKVIHNGIEAEEFQMLDKSICRKKLNLPANSLVFTFVAQNIHEGRKGLKELIAALSSLNIPNIHLYCLGGYDDIIPESDFPLHCVGFIKDAATQSLYYSASDYFVMPSFQESFGQTPIEAMSCGTPVIAFPTGIVPDLINNQNGIICSDFTIEALAEGIRQAMEREYDREAIREDVICRFSYDKIARQYVELYNELRDGSLTH